jgi:hypothetical protein
MIRMPGRWEITVTDEETGEELDEANWNQESRMRGRPISA